MANIDIRLRKASHEQLKLLTSGLLKYFADSPPLVYEAEQEEPILHSRGLQAYDGAVKAMETFVDNILTQEILVKHVRYAEAVLYLPDSPLKVSVSKEGNIPLKEAGQGKRKTTSGIFDDFTWDVVSSTEFNDNPVWLFYDYMVSNIKTLESLLMACGVEWRTVPINQPLLQECHIQEVVGIHNMLHLQHEIYKLLMQM